MASTWRNTFSRGAPDRVRSFIDAHERLEAIAIHAGLGPADEITHDLVRAEICAKWEQTKLEVVVEEIGKSDRERR
jgi:hypothetical protein